MKNTIFPLFVIALLGMTACVEDATLPCGDFSLDRELVITPVEGEGCRLTLQMDGVGDGFEKAAFEVTTYNSRRKQQGEPATYQVANPSDPSVTVRLSSPLYRHFKAYAYVIVDGMRFETAPQWFEIPAHVVPNPVVTVESVTSHITQLSDFWPDGIKGEIVLQGSGFLPFERWSYNDYDLSEYVTVKSTAKDFSVVLQSATEHEMRLTYDCQNFGPQSFRLTQAGQNVEVTGITVVAPDTLLSPTHPLRAYEIWRPEFANGSYSTRMGIDVNRAFSATVGTHVGPLRFLPSEPTFVTTQRLNGHLLDVPVTFTFSAPWQKIGSLGQSMTDYKGLRWLHGAYWWYVGDRLYRFDQATRTVRQYTMPVSSERYHRGVRLAEADDGTLIIGFWEMLGWDHQSWLYRLDPDSGSWTRLEHRSSDMTSYYNYMWQRGDILYQLGDKVLTARDLVTGEVSSRTVNTPSHDAVYLAFEDGRLFGYGVYRAAHDLFWFDPMQNVLQTQAVPTVEEEYSFSAQYNSLVNLSTAPLSHRGDWVYYSSQPCMRVSLSDGGKTKEYLGAPLGMHDRIFLLPFDDEVLCIDTQTGDIYQFVEDL